MARTSSNIRWTFALAPLCAFSFACSAETAPPGATGGGGSGAATSAGGSGNVGAGTAGGAGGAGATNPTGGASGAGAAPPGGSSGSGGSPGGTGGQTQQGTFPNYQLTGHWPELTSVVPQAAGTLTYTKVQVHNRFLAESCSIADYNADGVPDVSSGKRWYQGPDFLTEHVFRDGHGDLPRDGLMPEIDTGVSDDWADFPYDVNSDGFADIINIANCDVNPALNVAPEPMPQTNATAYWYQNPGAGWDADPKWTANLMHADVRHEHKGIVDVNGDGKPELFAACKGCDPAQTKGYYSADWANPTAAWTYTPVTPTLEFPFNGTGWMHGLGFGDVTGDNLPDMLDRVGVWDQGAGWTLIQQDLYNGNEEALQMGAAHMFTADFDGDGDKDIFAAEWAHGEGLAWYEQTTPGAFIKHMFMGGPGDEGMYGVYFSQPHAAQVWDMDMDGTPDIVTGKMRFAHPNGYGDPDLEGAPVVYVFKGVRGGSNASGDVTFQPVLVDSVVGVGRQLSIGHANTDGIMDICVGTKLGLYVFMGG